MCEVYQAYADYHDMMELIEGLICRLVEQRSDSMQLKFSGRLIDYTQPWRRATYSELFAEHVELDMKDIGPLRQRARELQIEEAQMDDTVLVNTLFEHYVEPRLENPTFVLDYPAPHEPEGQIPLRVRKRA